MAQLTVWECDKCGWQVTGSEMPRQWGEVHVSVDRGEDSEYNKHFIFCPPCTKKVVAPERGYSESQTGRV